MICPVWHDHLHEATDAADLRCFRRFGRCPEKLNGKGYPRGLAAPDIPIQTRIIAMADIFEALTASDRPYRKGNTLADAMRIMELMVKRS
jgi:hypothetical protein